MKKSYSILTDWEDWVQFKCNTSAKSETLVKKSLQFLSEKLTPAIYFQIEVKTVWLPH